MRIAASSSHYRTPTRSEDDKEALDAGPRKIQKATESPSANQLDLDMPLQRLINYSYLNVGSENSIRNARSGSQVTPQKMSTAGQSQFDPIPELMRLQQSARQSHPQLSFAARTQLEHTSKPNTLGAPNSAQLNSINYPAGSDTNQPKSTDKISKVSTHDVEPSKKISGVKTAESSSVDSRIETGGMLYDIQSVWKVCEDYGEFATELYSAVVKMHPLSFKNSPISEKNLCALADVCRKASSPGRRFLQPVSQMFSKAGIPNAKDFHEYFRLGNSENNAAVRDNPSTNIPLPEIKPDYDLAFHLLSMQPAGAGLPPLDRLKKFMAHWKDPTTGKTDLLAVKNGAWYFKGKGIPTTRQIRNANLID